MLHKYHTALVIAENGELEFQSVTTRSLHSKDMLLSIEYAGICGTDLQILKKMRSDGAKILGHEGVGKVIEVGATLSQFHVGQKVVFNPVNPNSQNDILGHSTEGVFQECFWASEHSIDQGLVLPCEENLCSDWGTLLEPLATVIYGHSLVQRVCSERTVAIIGAGPIGLMHFIYSKIHGLEKVFLVDSSPRKLEWILSKNLARPCELVLNDKEAVKNIIASTGGRGVDAAYLCTPRDPALSVLRMALQCLKDGGCVDMVGGFSDGDCLPEIGDIDLNSIRRGNICGIPEIGYVRRARTSGNTNFFITGHRGTSVGHLQKAMQVLGDYHELFSAIITHKIAFRDAARILNALKRGCSEIDGRLYVKGVIRFDGT